MVSRLPSSPHVPAWAANGSAFKAKTGAKPIVPELRAQLTQGLEDTGRLLLARWVPRTQLREMGQQPHGVGVRDLNCPEANEEMLPAAGGWDRVPPGTNKQTKKQ